MIVQEPRFIILNNNPLNFERKVQELNDNSRVLLLIIWNPLKQFNDVFNDEFQRWLISSIRLFRKKYKL